MIFEIMQGYFITKEPLFLNQTFSDEGIAYVPNLGYYNRNSELIDEINIIENTKIELLIHPVNLLESIFMFVFK